MKIFICWSGPLSHAVAELLRVWLKSVIQAVDPFLSSENIPKGTDWFSTIQSPGHGSRQLATYSFLSYSTGRCSSRVNTV